MNVHRLFASLLAALTLGCGIAAEPAAPASAVPERRSSSLEAAFQQAGAEYQVPVGLLKAIAQVESGVTQHAQSASGGFGVMQLAAREDWRSLARAAQLTGADEARLKLDARANILGGAAVLRELADKTFAQSADLNPSDPADFWDAVTLYAGLTQPDLAQAYAREVYTTLEHGFTAEQVTLAPTFTGWRKHLPALQARQDLVKEYPGAYQWKASKNFTAGRDSYSLVLIHTTQGKYPGALDWFFSPNNTNTSAHYFVRSSDGQVTQMVEHKNSSWHAQCYNRRSIAIEHEGFIAQPSVYYTEAMYRESAKLTRWIADRHGIPRDRSHIIGHYQVPASCNTNAHSDPGSGWNWTKYMQLVNGVTPTPTSGKLMGNIYQKGNTNDRVAGAVVTVAGKSVTTGTDGLYEFVLAPGTYTATVTKAGYSSASVSRVVTAGATIWGSMEINASTAVGHLRGKIYEYVAASPTDMTKPISGATVTVGANTQTTAADGFYNFALPPGTYTVNVSKAGWASNTVTRTVTASADVWGSVGLMASGGPDQQPPALAIAFPVDKASTDIAVLTLTGTASDNAGPIAGVTLKLNGGAPANVPVSGGRFSQEVKLAPGANLIEISAKDAAGNTGGDSATVTFNAGVAGFVYVTEDEASRVKDATLELIDPKTGDKVASATAGADGAYALSVSKVPGDYLLVARAEGFMTHSETVSIPDDERLKLDVPLTPGADPVPTEVALTFVDPQDGATVTGESVTVYGSVVGFDLASVAVNGVAAEQLGVEGFSAVVPLLPGANVLEAVAKGTKGESVSNRMTIHRATEEKKGGCAAVPGLELGALLLLMPLLRGARRRR